MGRCLAHSVTGERVIKPGVSRTVDFVFVRAGKPREIAVNICAAQLKPAVRQRRKGLQKCACKARLAKPLLKARMQISNAIINYPDRCGNRVAVA